MSARRPDLARLDFAHFARQFDRCLRQDRGIAFAQWRDIVAAVPPDLQDFFWRVVEVNLSPAAETRLRSLREWRGFHGEILDARFRRPSADRPQYSQRASGGDKRYKGVKFNKADGVDVNNDRIKDAGRLTEGTYQYFEKKGGYLGDRAFQVKTTQVAERDTDGDGRFTQDDKSRIDPKGAGTSMYIHRGGADTVLEPNTWSAGCQTVPKNRYPTFLKAIGRPGAFYYVLVNAAS